MKFSGAVIVHLPKIFPFRPYINNLNNAVADTEWANMSVEEICRQIDSVPETLRTTVRNNGGGHANHSLFWKIMGPNAGGVPGGALGDAINAQWVSFEEFKAQFKAIGVGRFGSGWAWLVVKADGSLDAHSLPGGHLDAAQATERGQPLIPHRLARPPTAGAKR
ncbi:MAG: superoxide dismutase [Caldilinea sp.]